MTSNPRVPQPPRAGRRRAGRLLALLLFLLLLPAGFLVNAGPYREYAQAGESLREKEQEVALVEQDIATLRTEMKRLGEDSYMEALARKELTYARPGEDMFIVMGLPEAAEAAEAEERAALKPSPGPLERLVQAVRGAF